MIPVKNDSGDINTLAPALPCCRKFPEDRPARQRIVKEGLTRRRGAIGGRNPRQPICFSFFLGHGRLPHARGRRRRARRARPQAPWCRRPPSPRPAWAAGSINLHAVAALADRSRRRARRCRSVAGAPSTSRRPRSAQYAAQPGTQERVDLVFLWPSLEAPPGDHGDGRPAPPIVDRTDFCDHRRRALRCRRRAAQTIYPRYVAPGTESTGRPAAARLPRRHAVSGRGPDLRSRRARAMLMRCTKTFARKPGTACTSGDRQRRHHGALSARLASRLARGRPRHRAADRGAQPAA